MNNVYAEDSTVTRDVTMSAEEFCSHALENGWKHKTIELLLRPIVNCRGKRIPLGVIRMGPERITIK